MTLLANPPTQAGFPRFEPPPYLTNGHLQTIVARYAPGPRVRMASTYHEVELGSGDRLSVLQSIPGSWKPGDPAVVMVHGLAGCVRSPYLARVGLRLYRMGIRVIRMNMRGAGSGHGISRSFYHGGRSEDPRAVVEWLARQTPDSPIALVGFSLGANVVLKLAGEAADDPVGGFDCVIAANPPLDLLACCLHIRRPQSRVYDSNFIHLLKIEDRRLRVAFPDLPPIDLSMVRNLFEFDDIYTAPSNGFRDASEYYEQSSSAPLIPKIKAPGIVIHAADDPFIPVEPLLGVKFPPQLALELNPHGGHLGYLSRHFQDGSRRWLDARIAAWLASRWGLVSSPREFVYRDQSPARSYQGGRNAHVQPQ